MLSGTSEIVIGEEEISDLEDVQPKSQWKPYEVKPCEGCGKTITPGRRRGDSVPRWFTYDKMWLTLCETCQTDTWRSMDRDAYFETRQAPAPPDPQKFGKWHEHIWRKLALKYLALGHEVDESLFKMRGKIRTWAPEVGGEDKNNKNNNEGEDVEMDDI